jgi:Icc-related predicted phosphoesterase
MQFGGLGDIHGDFQSAHRIMERHPEVPFWVCVGDIADADGRYEDLPAPLYWIKGNNENFDLIASGDFPANLLYIANGQLMDVDGLTIAGLGGTLAPTWYETRAADLPPPPQRRKGGSKKDDKRRHFVREEVAACVAMRGVDLFLTHEAPRPYRIGRIDAGKTPINEVLVAMRPRLHLFGHHHRFSEQQQDGVRSVGLDLVSRSYLLIDSETMAVTMQLVSPS